MKIAKACTVILLFILFAVPCLSALGGQEAATSNSVSAAGAQLVTMLITWVIILVPLGLIPANIAKKKGRKFARWWIYGIFLFLIALIHALSIAAKTEPTKKCPYCAEDIKLEAKFCRFCGKELVPPLGNSV